MPLASARQHPENQKENQAGHSSERTVEGRARWKWWWWANPQGTPPSLIKIAQLPTTVTHHRRVARLGLAMDNLESEWNFSEATLAYARTSGCFALRVCAVDLKNAPETAETLDKIKQCLAASQIEVEREHIKVKPLRAGSTSTLQDIFIVARLLPKASKMVQLTCNGPAGAYIDSFLTSQKLAESRRRATTHHAPSWRSCHSMAQSSARWLWSAQ